MELDFSKDYPNKNDWVGEIKKRESFLIIVDKIIPIQSKFGESLLHIMHDYEGNKLTWFASSGIGMSEGGHYHIKATPKRHEKREYRGVSEKQTIINRVAFLIK